MRGEINASTLVDMLVLSNFSQIYNETIKDLLVPSIEDQKPLELREDAEKVRFRRSICSPIHGILTSTFMLSQCGSEIPVMMAHERSL